MFYSPPLSIGYTRVNLPVSSSMMTGLHASAKPVSPSSGRNSNCSDSRRKRSPARSASFRYALRVTISVPRALLALSRDSPAFQGVIQRVQYDALFIRKEPAL
jgi:hypothetical protein